MDLLNILLHKIDGNVLIHSLSCLFSQQNPPNSLLDEPIIISCLIFEILILILFRLVNKMFLAFLVKRDQIENTLTFAKFST